MTILRWCMQALDVYDWNPGKTKTVFLVPDAMLAGLPLPPEALSVIHLPFAQSAITINDEYFRDLEVSGCGRAFLVRSDPFEPPKKAMDPITIEI